MNKFEDIKNRLAAATPGPWEAIADDVDTVSGDGGETYIRASSGHVTGSIYEDVDAEFIAHAPEDIARLVKALEAVTERLDKMHMEAHARTCAVDESRRREGSLFMREVKKLRKAITEALEGEQ